MTPNINDLFTLVAINSMTSLAAPGYTVGADTITAQDLSEWATIAASTAVFFAMDEYDPVTKKRVANTYNEYKGVISGNVIGSMQHVGGDGNRDYPAGTNTRVYIPVSGALWNSLINGLLVSHDQSGALKANSVGSTQIAPSAVGTTQLSDLGTTRAKLATVTRSAPLIVFGRTVSGVSAPWPASSDCQVQFYFVVPDDYVSGDLTIKVDVHGATVTGEVLRFYRRVYRARDGESLLTIEGTPVFSNTTVDGNKVLQWTFTIAAAHFQVGDTIRIELNRDGPGAADTSAQDVHLDGAWAEYQGKA